MVFCYFSRDGLRRGKIIKIFLYNNYNGEIFPIFLVILKIYFDIFKNFKI